VSAALLPLGVIVIDIDPVLLRLGPLALHWYGLMYAAGIAVGLTVVGRYARQQGITGQVLGELAWGTGLAALLGGRLYYVAQTRREWYLAHPLRVLAAWDGGMAFYGALFAGAPVLALLAHRRGVSPWRALDVAALFAPLAQAVGRVGNLINGDVVGYPSALPWATAYTNSGSFAVHGVAYQPAAAYELLFSLALFALLWRLRGWDQAPGSLFALYVCLYAGGQFVLFYWRDNPLLALGLKQAQLTSLAVLAAAGPLLWWRIRRIREAQPDSGRPGAAP